MISDLNWNLDYFNVMSIGILFKTSILTAFLWPHFHRQGCRCGITWLLLGGLQLRIPYTASIDTKENVSSLLVSVSGSSSSPLGFHWYHLGWRNKLLVSAHLVIFISTTWGKAYYHLKGIKVLVSSMTLAVMERELGWLIACWEAGSLNSELSLFWSQWICGCSLFLFFLWCLAGLEQLLSKIFFLLDFSFPCPFVREHRLPLGLCVFVYIPLSHDT